MSSDLLVFIRVNGWEHKDAGDDVDTVRPELLHQLLSRDVALEGPDVVLKLNIRDLDFPWKYGQFYLVVKWVVFNKLDSSGREITAIEVERQFLLYERKCEVANPTANLQ